jgi:hypothetical protein
MNPRLLALAGLGVALAVTGRAQTLETRVLTDLNLPGEWKTHQWNKAQGRIAVREEFPEEVKTEAGQKRESLGVKVTWPGGEGFRFFSIEPSAKPEPIPFKVVEASFWLKGSGTQHFIEFHFTDATGKDVKVGPHVRTDSTDWKKVSVKIPSSFQQPLAIKTITFHDFGIREPAEATMYVTRYEVTVDTSQKVGGPGGAAAGGGGKPSKSNDNW